MKKTTKRLADLDLRTFGNSVLLTGVVYSDAGGDYVIKFPGESALTDEFTEISMGAGDWDALLRQVDEMETEVLAQAPDGKLVKAVLRKCDRVIAQGVSWRVYKRDGYTCRYCGADDVPLSVDHLVLWEQGGPSVEENLVAACRSCNKARGNTPFAQWLESDYYKRVSERLTPEARARNEQLTATLDAIPRRFHRISR